MATRGLYKITVTPTTLRVLSTAVPPLFDVSYKTADVKIYDGGAGIVVLYETSIPDNGTYMNWRQCVNIRAGSQVEFTEKLQTLITTQLTITELDSLAITGALTANTVTATGAVTGGSLTTAGAVTSATLTTTGAVTADSVASTNAVTAASVTTTGAVSADSATLGTMTVSSAGALGGTYDLGRRVYVTGDFFLQNVTSSFQNMGTEMSTFGITRRNSAWPDEITWESVAVGCDDQSGHNFEVRFYTDNGGAAIQDQQFVSIPSTNYQHYYTLGTGITTTQDQAYWFTLRQSGGTTGSEVTLTVFGYYDI